ncbi:hypothetical protein L596_004043 [Steinernema carpocapsae]|uniref:Secreted protein n=1 Tax=Steinernema carpocapsae TaxID=34508 RepID=A0A4U8UUH7_STECR|nr:hypothetical protein L596_004043 [Steinernema carpocapsae]
MGPLLRSIVIFILAGFCLSFRSRHIARSASNLQLPGRFEEIRQTPLRAKIITGTVGRYAPQEWPTWYTRHIFKWNGESRQSPYHPNDVKYSNWQRIRFSS